MRLGFLADLRSPPARQWIGALVERGHDVHAISSHPVDPEILPGANVSVIPLVFSRAGAAMTQARGSEGRDSSGVRLLRRLATPSSTATARALVGPPAVSFRRRALQEFIDRHRPDVFHAMRIPYEGMAAARITGVPLVVSVWGNDFTLYARRTRLMAHATRLTLTNASALHCDCFRDARLAREWGFPAERPIWMLPGNGGVVESVFRPGPSLLRRQLGIPDDSRIVVNPRGVREYVQTDTLFAALADVLGALPDVHVVCPGVVRSPTMENLVASHRLHGRVHLLPPVDRNQMADIFRAARVSVSLSTHDGTPNTLLEAMACGAVPVVGNVESVCEWVTHDRNGLVVPPDNREAVSVALIRALTDDALVESARAINKALVHERASFTSGIRQIAEHYGSLVAAWNQRAGPRSR